MKYLLSSIFAFLLFFAEAQSVIITGNAKTYAGDTLVFYKYSDFLTNLKSTVCQAIVDTSGSFTFNTTVSEPNTELHIDLAVFEGILYVSPADSFVISLPKKTAKLKEDELNPYFKPMQFYVPVLNAKVGNTNAGLTMYERLYAQMMPKIFEGSSGRVNSAKAEAQIKYVEDSFARSKNSFLQDYVHYDLAHVRFLAYKRNKQKLLDIYFADTLVLHRNPAYNRALTEIFGNYLFEQKALKLDSQILLGKDFTQLVASTQKVAEIENPHFAEYLILLNLVQKFNTENYSKARITEYLSKNINLIQSPDNKRIAQTFITEASKLIVGNPVPNFMLKNEKGELVSINTFRGRFIYLNFCDPESYTCQQDMELMQALHEKETDLLDIVTVWTGGTYNDMLKYRKDKGYTWTFLYGEGSSALTDYKVVSFPTYFLIHPESTLQIRPAASPGSSDFEPMYFFHYREWKRELVRRGQLNPNGGKTIINE